MKIGYLFTYLKYLLRYNFSLNKHRINYIFTLLYNHSFWHCVNIALVNMGVNYSQLNSKETHDWFMQHVKSDRAYQEYVCLAWHPCHIFGQQIKCHVRAYLILLHGTLLCFTDIMFLIHSSMGIILHLNQPVPFFQ